MAASGSFQWLDLTTNISEAHVAMRNPLHGHASVLVGDSIYVFGGSDGFTSAEVNTMYKLNLENFQWSLVEIQDVTLPSRRFFVRMVLAGDKLYIYGGRNKTDMYFFDLVLDRYFKVTQEVFGETDHLLEERRETRFGVSLVYWERRHALLLFGGKSDSKEVQLFDLELRRWFELVTKGVTPPGITFQSSCLRGDFWFIYGGLDARLTSMNSLFVLDMRLSTPLWVMLAPNSNNRLGRAHASIILHKDTLIVFGGIYRVNRGAEGLWQYDLRRNIATDVDELELRGFETQRSSHTAEVLPGKDSILILGGISRFPGGRRASKALYECGLIRIITDRPSDEV